MVQDTKTVLDYCTLKKLPSHDELFSLLDKAVNVLENESKEIRPLTKEGNVGGLIELQSPNPTIIVPDIHARPEFIKNILEFKFPKETIQEDLSILELLEQNKINVVCVGDAFHTEKTYERWQKIIEEFLKNQFSAKYMKQEMTECLASFCALLKLKISFPEQFFFLKGNHENILNSSFNGDRAFYKYAQEGEMVKLFITESYGEDVLYLISLYESLLPLLVKLPMALVSHAEPAFVLDRNQLINIKEEPELVYSLIWTKNGDVKTETAKSIIKNLYTKLSSKEQDNIVYFCGHRPVKDIYEKRQNGKIIQIHNPEQQNIALVDANKKFNIDNNFYNVQNKGGIKNG